MASTDPKANKQTEDKETKSKKQETKTEKESLAEQLAKFYGVDEDKDDDKFIKAVSEASVEKAKREQNHDPMREAQMSEKLGRYRQLAETTKSKDLTQAQKDLKKTVEDEYEGVGITFPDDKTWELNVGGKQDSGNMDVPESAILSSAERLKKVPAGE